MQKAILDFKISPFKGPGNNMYIRLFLLELNKINTLSGNFRKKSFKGSCSISLLPGYSFFFSLLIQIRGKARIVFKQLLIFLHSWLDRTQLTTYRETHLQMVICKNIATAQREKRYPGQKMHCLAEFAQGSLLQEVPIMSLSSLIHNMVPFL